MTKKQALKEFKELYPKEHYYYGYIHAQKIDSVARCLDWTYYIDSLCKEGQITMKQYENWSNPF